MPIRFLEKLPIGCRYRHAKNNIYKKDMKRFKEKPKAIWHILKGGQYAVFVVNNGYVDFDTTPNKAACLIPDNAEEFFLESIVEFTEKYIVENN